ncbi:MAG: ATP-binding protein, partial [Candidatus Thiodiazotropha taylori]
YLFEPFFTTKAPGEGTGLGLAIAYKIVSDHKGAITIDSDQGEGTRVIMDLPRTFHDKVV